MYLVLFLVDLLYFKKLLQNLEETFFIISSTWSVNFQMVLPFYMSLSFGCLFSICHRRELLAKK